MKLTADTVLTRGVEEILPSKKQLQDLIDERKITIYQGFDPTAPSLHIGHFIGIRKLAQFQKLGHKVIFLIGDFTAMIGDPTDKKSVRQPLSKEQVLSNLKDYKKQVAKLINFEGENKAEIRFNSEWLSKLNLAEILILSSDFTVQQMLERDMFQERIKSQKPIHLHEFFYPLLQGYDSVELEVDLEIGGNDQLFNMLAGRTLTKNLKGKDKFVLSMKLLTDKEGKKMGKTEGNAVFLSDSANEIFGKIMSWSDDLLKSSVELLTDFEASDISGKSNLEIKKMLAFDIVRQVKGEEEAGNAQEHFEKTFQKKDPDYATKIILEESLVKTIAPHTPMKSNSDAKRLIDQKAVEVNGKVVQDSTFKIEVGDRVRIGSITFGTVVAKK